MNWIKQNVSDWPEDAKYFCPLCNIYFNESGIMHQHYADMIQKEQPKMTREEAIKKLDATVFGYNSEAGKKWIEFFEVLGLLKFDEEKKISSLFEFKDRNCKWTENYDKVDEKYGTIRLEEWPEGLVLWVGGEIRWKSWHEYSDITNPVR